MKAVRVTVSMTPEQKRQLDEFGGSKFIQRCIDARARYELRVLPIEQLQKWQQRVMLEDATPENQKLFEALAKFNV